ncbi:hypothetical protein LY632_09590 [Erythrobacter sp. SDW2]|uniref:hypothetical protein n=1 Tax=Erythrobacter sp. SDW2 TaxID=2907154 RepID=UPI001F2A53D8|nr:hypothetical protein [Erythrobacter sp. SDW2]UIP05954.1 hypothetical protein LY632_09590 [Erythrobacter sp. SDW2]
MAAQSAIDIRKSVYIERAERQGDRVVRALEPATTLRKGDSVVLMLTWSASGQSDSFTVSSPVPRDLAFKRSGGRDAQVSIDGGNSWGQLTEMRIGARRASPEEVTHLRWQVSREEALRGKGMLSYSAIVR